MLKKIVSGGQTGIDRAALDTAIKVNFPYGGWCPKGRLAEDGTLANYYQLKETATDNYSERTELNVRDSDGTLIIVSSLPIDTTDGTPLTLTFAKQLQKPYLIIALNDHPDIQPITNWIIENKIKTLNIAGPRESQSPGIYQQATPLLNSLLKG